MPGLTDKALRLAHWIVRWAFSRPALPNIVRLGFCLCGFFGIRSPVPSGLLLSDDRSLVGSSGVASITFKMCTEVTTSKNKMCTEDNT